MLDNVCMHGIVAIGEGHDIAFNLWEAILRFDPWVQMHQPCQFWRACPMAVPILVQVIWYPTAVEEVCPCVGHTVCKTI